MISIQITSHGIQMHGHAGRKDSDGIDRACAAVSALTCNLINSLRLNDPPKVVHCSTQASCKHIFRLTISSGHRIPIFLMHPQAFVIDGHNVAL